MPRTPNDAPITTKASRARLALQDGGKPHWRSVSAGLALGWRRGMTGGGTWVARVMLDGRYREARLAAADDVLSHNGADVLTFSQAQSAAVAWADKQRRIAAGLEAEPVKGLVKLYTLGDALEAYLAQMKLDGKGSYATTATAAKAHITPALGSLPFACLTRKKVAAWHRALADAPPRRRTSANSDAPYPPVGSGLDPDAIRRRRATANRVLTILKAACNHARNHGLTTGSDDAWKLVKPFGRTDVPKVRYLDDVECKRLVNACPPDFRALVSAALLTGCRYGELATARVGDLDMQAGTLHIPQSNSKSGNARHVILNDEGRAFFTRIALGKQSDALLFQRDEIEKQATRTTPAVMRRVAWGKSDQFRKMATACTAARIAPAISFHILRHTYATRLASSGKVTLMMIAAQLGHSDTRLTERHYAHLVPSYTSNALRSVEKLGIEIQQSTQEITTAIIREFVPGRVA